MIFYTRTIANVTNQDVPSHIQRFLLQAYAKNTTKN
jgi:hypothetical protein